MSTMKIAHQSVDERRSQHGDTRLATDPDGPALTLAQSQERRFRTLPLWRTISLGLEHRVYAGPAPLPQESPA
jgi:hypothetical protein